MVAYARISQNRIRCRSIIIEPDVVVVFDPKLPLIVDVFQGLKDNGVIILNSSCNEVKCIYKTYCVDANRIAKELGLVLAGWPLVNTSMLGAVLKATGLFDIKYLLESVKEYIRGNILEHNIKAVEEAYNSTCEVC